MNLRDIQLEKVRLFKSQEKMILQFCTRIKIEFQVLCPKTPPPSNRLLPPHPPTPRQTLKWPWLNYLHLNGHEKWRLINEGSFLLLSPPGSGWQQAGHAGSSSISLEMVRLMFSLWTRETKENSLLMMATCGARSQSCPPGTSNPECHWDSQNPEC